MSTPNTNSVSYTEVAASGDFRIDDLFEGLKWGGRQGTGVTLTYSFPATGSRLWSTSASAYGPTSGSGEPWSRDYAGLSTDQQAATVSALAQWANVANITFVRVSESATTVGDIRVAWTYGADIADAQAYAYSIASSPASADIWLNPYAGNWDGFAVGGYGYNTVLHEIGHTLGLTHTFAGSGSLGGALPSAQDGYRYSIMSYSAWPGDSRSDVNFQPTTPMLYDLLAVQYLYGANRNFHSGNDTYSFTQGQSYFQTLWDGGGSDTIVWNASTESARIDLRAGQFSDLGQSLLYTLSNGTQRIDADTVAIAYGVTIENADGGGADDTLIGNDAHNVLRGGDGNDTLTGGAGQDTLDGGSGIDTAVFNGARASYTLGGTASARTVTDRVGTDGMDNLGGIERLHYSDGWLALDLDGNAGVAARVLGAVLGPTAVSNRAYAGYALAALDGGTSATALVQAALQFMLGANPGDDAVVRLLYQNLTGALPSAADQQYWVQTLQSGQFNAASLGLMAANSSVNADHIQLAGLAQSGLAFVV